MTKVIPPVKPYFSDEDIERIKSDVEKILRSGMLTMHKYTLEFEEKFSRLCGVRYAVAVNSGTSALEIALRSIGLKKGDEVLVPTNTFSATAAAVFFAGGKPVFTDVDSKSLCIDAKNVQEHATRETVGVIVVHIGGLICPDIESIRKICSDKGLFLIEDAAHAHGSTFRGKSAGTFGNVGCYSFYPTKVMTTGEGGVVITENERVDKIARILRDQGKESFTSETIVKLGYNWRLPEISAAIGLVQLENLPEIVERRNRLARFYDQKLRNIDGITPLKVPEESRSCYYKYVCFLDPEFNRDEFKLKLREKGVRCGGEVYWPPLHMQPVYKELLKTNEGDFPQAEDMCRRMLCLPIYAQMGMDEAEYVVEKIRETFSET